MSCISILAPFPTFSVKQIQWSFNVGILGHFPLYSPQSTYQCRERERHPNPWWKSWDATWCASYLFELTQMIRPHWTFSWFSGNLFDLYKSQHTAEMYDGTILTYSLDWWVGREPGCFLYGSSYNYKLLKRQCVNIEKIWLMTMWLFSTLFQEVSISTVENGAWKFATVQTLEIKFQILLKVPVCIAQFPVPSLPTTIRTSPNTAEKWRICFWQMANLAGVSHLNFIIKIKLCITTPVSCPAVRDYMTEFTSLKPILSFLAQEQFRVKVYCK